MLTNGKQEVEAQLRAEAGSMGGLGQIAKLLQVLTKPKTLNPKSHIAKLLQVLNRGEILNFQPETSNPEPKPKNPKP